jgi:hypothetical protein
LDGSTLTNDTFTNNASGNLGGAIFNQATGDLKLFYVTINGNTAEASGGGILFAGAGTLSLVDSFIAGDSAPVGPDVFTLMGHPVNDQGNNLVGNLSGATGFGAGTLTGNPNLGPLENNGGFFAGAPSVQQVVQTEALLPGSPAFAKGVALVGITTDERGFPRPGGGNTNPSIGAYEPQYLPGASLNQIFVENLYETLLGRPGDAGAAGWVSPLNQGLSPTAVIVDIENSVEYRNIEVQNLYQHYLHRAADAGGLQGFVNFLGTGGTVEQVAAILVGSPEYFQLHGGNDQEFVEALYQDILNRQGDVAAMASFDQALGNGMSRQALAALIFASPEYRADLVEIDFQNYLGRQADPNGLAGFVNTLAAEAQISRWRQKSSVRRRPSPSGLERGGITRGSG